MLFIHSCKATLIYNNAYSKYCQRKKDDNQRTQKLDIYYYRQVWFSKENSYYSMKCQKKKDLLLLAIILIEKIPDATNAKQNYQSYLKRKNTKLVRRSNITIPNNYSTPKNFWKTKYCSQKVSYYI